MSTESLLSRRKVEAIAPQGQLVLRPDDFAPFEGRPSEPISAGLRLLTITQRQAVEQWVASSMRDYRLPEDETRVRLYVSYGICDANDLAKPFRWFDRPQDQVFTHLTGPAAQRIFEALLRLEVETSLLHPEASPEDILELYEKIADGWLDIVSPADRSACLRHLGFALEVLRTEA